MCLGFFTKSCPICFQLIGLQYCSIYALGIKSVTVPGSFKAQVFLFLRTATDPF